MGHLDGRRVLVVGASAGIGRALAVEAAGAGARVVVAARRGDVLDEVVAEADAAGPAGPARGTRPIVADVGVDEDRLALVAQATEHLGRIDLVLYTVGVADLAALVDTDAAAWTRTFAVNVVAFNQLVRELVPVLESGAIVAVLSSEAAQDPRVALVAYSASKAALEVSVRGWRAEHPTIRFSCVAAGATVPTDFGRDFEGATLGRAFDHWARQGQIQEAYMDAGELARVLVAAYGAALDCPSVGVEHLALRSPSAPAAAYPRIPG